LARARHLVTAALFAVLGMVLPGAPASAGESGPALFHKLLAKGDAAYAQVRDYTAQLRSVERVGGRLEPARTITLKFARPFKVYMRWLDGDAEGREGLYAAGENDGKFLLADRGGLAKFFTMRLDPRDPRILERTRHPVTDVGLGRLLELIGEPLRPAATSGTLRVADLGAGQLDGRAVQRVEATLAKRDRPAQYGRRVELSFDAERHLLVRVVVHDWDDQLVEDYTYTKLVLNPGLGTTDFDAGNPRYNFGGWRLRF
jgi:hypothetical protein